MQKSTLGKIFEIATTLQPTKSLDIHESQVVRSCSRRREGENTLVRFAIGFRQGEIRRRGGDVFCVDGAHLREEEFECRESGGVASRDAEEDHAAVDESRRVFGGGKHHVDELSDQAELVGVDEFVVGVAVHGGAHPMVDPVGGEEDWRAAIGP